MFCRLLRNVTLCYTYFFRVALQRSVHCVNQTRPLRPLRSLSKTRKPQQIRVLLTLLTFFMNDFLPTQTRLPANSRSRACLRPGRVLIWRALDGKHGS
jgi:hypothetical protein